MLQVYALKGTHCLKGNENSGLPRCRREAWAGADRRQKECEAWMTQLFQPMAGISFVQ